MRIGILGGGQLGKMMALAGYPLGLSFHFYDPDANCCSKELGQFTEASYSDETALKKFADSVDIITYENENIPLQTVELLKDKLFPSIEAIKITQDRLLEKEFIQKLGIPTTPFLAINQAYDLTKAIEILSFPFIIKTRRFGYDGKGQIVIRREEDLQQISSDLINAGLIAEKWVYFKREFSIIAVRSATELKYYDLCENVHQDGILATTHNKLNDDALLKALPYVEKLLQAFSYIGVMTVEFFEDQQGNCLVNEIAPRVHNSGHWTIEGAFTSQFQNHLRAGLNLPIGNTKSKHQIAMHNIIGTPPESLSLEDDHIFIHLYGKAPRPGRKLGHKTIILKS